MDLARRLPTCHSVVTYYYEGVAFKKGYSSHVHLNSLPKGERKDMRKTPTTNCSLARLRQVDANRLWLATASRALLAAVLFLCQAVAGLTQSTKSRVIRDM